MSPAAARANALKVRDTELSDRLMRFARARYGPHWLHDVLDSEDLLIDGELPDTDLPIVIPWLEHFKVNPSGATLAEEWQRHEGSRLSSDDRILLEAYGATWLSLWEVAEVQPGVGSRLKDRLTGEERFAHDVRSTSTLRRFDTVLAMIVTCGDVSFFGGVHTQPLPPRFAESAVLDARRLSRVRTRPVSRKKLREPGMQMELLALWSLIVEEMLHQPTPVLQNTDGDPVLLTKDDFALLAPRDDVAAQLRMLTGAEEPEQEGPDTVFVVTKAGNAMHRSWDNTIIGRVVLGETRLTVETNSTRRADFLRSAVEAQLQGQVRFRLRKEENTAQLLAAAPVPTAPHAPTASASLPPEALAELQEFRERHLRDWLDQNIPILDGLTPREAARLSRARSKLEVLLKELEQSEASLPEPQRMDLGWLREALGS